jgi:DNA-3-methyladenine glycosylase
MKSTWIKSIKEEFFMRSPEIVAKDLLGKFLVRIIRGKKFIAKIVETEAYFGPEDPASRARQNGDLRLTMEMDGGKILVYGVHNNWLLNFVTEEEGKASAVLIRALEPINFKARCNGPGLLTRALKIDKKFHKMNIVNNSEMWVENDDKIINKFDKKNKLGGVGLSEKDEMNKQILIESNHFNRINDKDFEIVESFRIGVVKDLEKPLRFYIKDNKHVSRK